MSSHSNFHAGDPEEWKPYVFIAFAVVSMFIILGIFVAFAVSTV